ncbi:Uncharacterized protein HZ326_14711 [Fusarium oxysporum f. sp. albedinis]|nr:Uncharacterized protein HZ326_14711 [Fusarium oxysporum f. sp. albedinis]
MFEFSSKMELHMRKNVANRNQGMMQRDNGLCSECQVNNDDTVIPTRLSMTFVLRMRKVQSEFADLLFRVAKFATWHDEKNRAVENISVMLLSYPYHPEFMKPGWCERFIQYIMLRIMVERHAVLQQSHIIVRDRGPSDASSILESWS